MNAYRKYSLIGLLALLLTALVLPVSAKDNEETPPDFTTTVGQKTYSVLAHRFTILDNGGTPDNDADDILIQTPLPANWPDGAEILDILVSATGQHLGIISATGYGDVTFDTTNGVSLVFTGFTNAHIVSYDHKTAATANAVVVEVADNEWHLVSTLVDFTDAKVTLNEQQSTARPLSDQDVEAIWAIIEPQLVDGEEAGDPITAITGLKYVDSYTTTGFALTFDPVGDPVPFETVMDDCGMISVIGINPSQTMVAALTNSCGMRVFSTGIAQLAPIAFPFADDFGGWIAVQGNSDGAGTIIATYAQVSVNSARTTTTIRVMQRKYSLETPPKYSDEVNISLNNGALSAVKALISSYHGNQ